MRIGVIGAGSWGTAIANMLGQAGNNVLLWARNPDVVSQVNCDHVNARYFPDLELSPNVVATVAYEDCASGADCVAVVTPSVLLRGAARALSRVDLGEAPVVLCSKGIEAKTGLLPEQVFLQELGEGAKLAVLSGPNHAEEVALGMPAATVVASRDPQVAQFVQRVFANERFRTYVSDDVVGVEACAALKNIIAIAVGLSYGMGYGDNTASMLMTRGLAEMSRLVHAMGGTALTCMGLAGMGDLIATCTSQHSRNRRFGELLARGGTLDEFTEQTHMVVEGAIACRTVEPLAERLGVEMPIAQVVRAVVWEGARAEDAAAELANRPLNVEFYGLD